MVLLLPTAPAGAMTGGAPDATGIPGRAIVMITGSGSSLCTGTAIASDLILTAAHCVQRNNVVRFSRTQAPLAIRAAAVHPRFSTQAYATKRATADVALIKLAAPRCLYRRQRRPRFRRRPRRRRGELDHRAGQFRRLRGPHRADAAVIVSVVDRRSGGAHGKPPRALARLIILLRRNSAQLPALIALGVWPRLSYHRRIVTLIWKPNRHGAPRRSRPPAS
jgi:hypothetical protein